MVHVALAVDGVDSVDHLVHASCAEGGEVEHLGLAPLEQAGSVCRGDDCHVRRQWPQVYGSTPVNADSVGHDAGTDDVLGDRPDSSLDLAVGIVHLGELRKQFLEEGGLHGCLCHATVRLHGDCLGFGNAVPACGIDRCPDLVAVVNGDLVRHDLGCTHGLDELQLHLDDLADVLL